MSCLLPNVYITCETTTISTLSINNDDDATFKLYCDELRKAYKNLIENYNEPSKIYFNSFSNIIGNDETPYRYQDIYNTYLDNFLHNEPMLKYNLEEKNNKEKFLNKKEITFGSINILMESFSNNDEATYTLYYEELKKAYKNLIKNYNKTTIENFDNLYNIFIIAKINDYFIPQRFQDIACEYREEFDIQRPTLEGYYDKN